MVSCVFPYQYHSPPPPPLPLPFPGGGGRKNILEKIACLSSGCAPAARLLIWSCHCKTWERRQDLMRTDYSVLTYRVPQGSLSLGFSVPRPRDGCERCLSRIPWYVRTYTHTHAKQWRGNTRHHGDHAKICAMFPTYPPPTLLRGYPDLGT